MKSFMGKGGTGGNARVYLAADCLEVEQQLPVDILRQRIYLDDVLMVTRSQRFGWQYLLACGAIAAICGMTALGLAISGYTVACLILVIIAAAATVLFAVRLILRLDVITIFGRRKRIEIVFGFNKESVQDRFDKIVAAVREKIQATEWLQNEAAAAAAPPPAIAEFPQPAEAQSLPDTPSRFDPTLPFVPEIQPAPAPETAAWAPHVVEPGPSEVKPDEPPI